MWPWLSTQKKKIKEQQRRLLEAIVRGDVATAHALLERGLVVVNWSDKLKQTALHCAWTSEVVRALLVARANLHAKDRYGREPLHVLCIQSHDQGSVSDRILTTLQVLVSFGARWDSRCDRMVADRKAWKDAPALRVCMSLWADEHAEGLELSTIPLDVIKGGALRTQTHITTLKTPREIVLRRKICVVGPSCTGKTSFAKSVTSNHPHLEHVDDRTIGIDHFPHCFQKPNERTRHEATFWDFAGQDAYQVAHSLFFSRRALYLVCIDLEAFANAYMQAAILAEEAVAEAELMDEFVEHAVMRWIYMIVARQPDAEVVFTATKADVLAANNVTEQLLKEHLVAKLKLVEATIQYIEDHADKTIETTGDAWKFRSKMSVGADSPEPAVVYVSCVSSASVLAARASIEDLIIQSKRSFQILEAHSQARAAIARIAEKAKRQDISTRIARVFKPVDSLSAGLNIEPKVCRSILRTLHDLGDVLWYEDLGVELFENTVILDPLLLIDFIREVFNPKNTGQVIRHADLEALPYWAALRDQKQTMEAMKQVLQAFHLVYTSEESGVMQWRSDLIVPALWQIKTPAARLFSGDILRLNTTKSRAGETVRVHWEYHFELGLPLSLFDHVVGASVSPDFTFDAGPDWIVFEEKEAVACRIVVMGRDRKPLHRTIHVEAVVSESATPEQVKTLWWSFRQLLCAFVGVLRENPSLQVSSFAIDITSDEQTKTPLASLMESKSVSANYMPPPATWAFFKRIVTEIPLEAVKRGAVSTQAYMDSLNDLDEIVLRRKICLVGSSCAGKTSLIKSITAEQPQLEHLDDRTIGIDHFPIHFSESISGTNKSKRHEVTFWDFAGQDAYQIAHSLFFSPRTLFLVCVDVGAFAIAYMQAVIYANEDFQESELLDEFLDYTVKRWVDMIVARQPNAEFVFIATKEDEIAGNPITEQLLKSHLKAKLLKVEATVHEMKTKHTLEHGPTESASRSAKTGTAEGQKEPSIEFVSCMSISSTRAARAKIRALVLQSGNSFQMPDAYSRVLSEVRRIQEAAKCQSMATRITRVFAPVSSLSAELKIEPELCRIILQTLHDLGDVLWYEDLGAELFQNTVILDPLFLIDFIRQIFNHKNTGQIMPHADLKALPYWLALRDPKQMEAMKQVLQAFHLVYSDDEDRIMEWDSDMIVPVYWQTKTPAAWLFLGDILRINSARSCAGEVVRVHWEYHFEFGLPLPLFDHLVVASVSPYVKFDAGPDWILYTDEGIAACRIMVGRDPKSLHRSIHVEAVVAEAATTTQADVLWISFRQLCGAFMKVLRENPGVLVSAFVWDDAHAKKNMKSLIRSKSELPSVNWMPPATTWEWFKRLVTGQSRS